MTVNMHLNIGTETPSYRVRILDVPEVGKVWMIEIAKGLDVISLYFNSLAEVDLFRDAITNAVEI